MDPVTNAFETGLGGALFSRGCFTGKEGFEYLRTDLVHLDLEGSDGSRGGSDGGGGDNRRGPGG